MNDLLIFTVAEGRYRVYTDLFTWCAKRAYPEYDVEVMDLHKTGKIPYWSACMRFLVLPDAPHKYTYITDVDMMICPETQAILDFHTEEMTRTGLCYSNVPRWKEPMGENRMTGLHFVSDSWWEKTYVARTGERDRLHGGDIGSCKCDDELMLMRIIKRSGLAVTERGNLLRRHHGIHLGTLRDYRNQTLQKRRCNVLTRIRKHAGYWCDLIETEDYKKLFADIQKQDKEATWELKELEKFARQTAGKK
jgi:hypothetical protein